MSFEDENPDELKFDEDFDDKKTESLEDYDDDDFEDDEEDDGDEE